MGLLAYPREGRKGIGTAVYHPALPHASWVLLDWFYRLPVPITAVNTLPQSKRRRRAETQHIHQYQRRSDPPQSSFSHFTASLVKHPSPVRSARWVYSNSINRNPNQNPTPNPIPKTPHLLQRRLRNKRIQPASQTLRPPTSHTHPL